MAERYLSQSILLDVLMNATRVRENCRKPLAILIVGCGGGSDCQQAYVLSQALETMLEGQNVESNIVFGTTKWRPKSYRTTTHVPTRCAYSIPFKPLPATYLNETVNGKPRWVGTTLFEGTIPPTVHEWECETNSSFTSPIIVEIPHPKDAGQIEYTCFAEEVAQDLLRLAPKRCGSDEFGAWDVVIGVDTGGDVLGGIEDSRDISMLKVLQKLVSIQKECAQVQAHFLLAILGLCVDGESYFEDMFKKLEILHHSKAVKGCFPLAPLAPRIREVCSAMNKSKTPQIILSCLEHELEEKREYNQVVLENYKGGHILRAETMIPTFPLQEKVDPIGRKLGEFVQIPKRHHVDFCNVPFPAPIVPLRWICDGVVFDANKVLDVLKL